MNREMKKKYEYVWIQRTKYAKKTLQSIRNIWKFSKIYLETATCFYAKFFNRFIDLLILLEVHIIEIYTFFELSFIRSFIAHIFSLTVPHRTSVFVQLSSPRWRLLFELAASTNQCFLLSLVCYVLSQYKQLHMLRLLRVCLNTSFIVSIWKTNIVL